jgi:Na+/melibiose symporter-like transporter
MFFVRPGELWQTAALLVFVSPLATTASNIAAGATMGDVIDYAKLRFNKDLGATYSATAIFVGKVSVGVGGALGLGIAGAFHFNPAESTHSAASLLGLKLAFIILPALFALLSLPFILRTPINRARHRIIQRRLQSRLARTDIAGADAPLTARNF